MKQIFTPFPTLYTRRLILRQTTKEDCPDIYFLRSNEAVNKYIKRPIPKNIADAKAFIQTISEGIENDELLYWSICRKKDKKMIGSISLWKFSEDRKEAEVGYDLMPRFHHQGLMSEALNAVLNFGFEILGIEEILAFTDYRNERSKNLLLKNNFKLIEGRTDQDNSYNYVYGLKRENKM
ncbi:MAG TPA: N-acetyltransferase [Saprospiraceae bacterium]|nr:N-acetyltransferase [Saprospiraceae bacterium]